jgi:hypothetical protein
MLLYIKQISKISYNFICDKVCQSLSEGLWFSPGTLVSSTNKTDRHDITEKYCFKVALNTITLTLTPYNFTVT